MNDGLAQRRSFTGELSLSKDRTRPIRSPGSSASEFCMLLKLHDALQEGTGVREGNC